MAARQQTSRGYRRYALIFLTFYKRRPDVQMFLEILLSLVAITAFIILALRPTFLTISQLIKDIRTKQEVVKRMEQKLKDLSAAQAVYSQESAGIALLETAIPLNPSPETYIRQIEGLANQNDVTILGIGIGETALVGENPKKTKKPKDYQPLPEGAGELAVTLNLSASYSALISFLEKLEKLRRPLPMDSVSLDLISKGEGEQIVLSIVGRAPFLEIKTQ
jgi:hypothetical protein